MGPLQAGSSELRTTPRLIAIEFPSVPAETVEYWRQYYGPTTRAFEALAADPARQAALRTDLERLWA